MTDYDRYDRLRQDLVARAGAPKKAAGGPYKPGWRHQSAALSIAEDWSTGHDLPALGLLDAAGRAEQLAARQALHAFADAIWEAPKWKGQAPTASAAYDAVAALRDLCAILVRNADEAIAAADDLADDR